MTLINAYLNFNGNCREVMSFYKECLGGELEMQVVGESPMAKDWPAQVQQHILHATLIKNGNVLLLGSDMSFEPPVQGSAITLSITCDTVAELESCFNKLAVDGNVTHELHDFFAGKIGDLTDKYGKHWMFYCANK